MIELIFHHKELTRRDLGVWALRSLVIGPALGVLPGLAWGALVFGPVDGSLAAGVAVGSLIGATLALLSTQALGMGTVKARTVPFVCAVLSGTGFALLAISLGTLIPNKPEWLTPLIVIVWLVALAVAGRKIRWK